MIDDAHQRDHEEHAEVTHELGHGCDIKCLRFVVVLLVDETRTGNLRGFVHRRAEEEAALERIAVKNEVSRERVQQHGDDTEQRDAGDRVGHLVVLGRDRRRCRNDRGGAADTRTDGDQRTQFARQTESSCKERDDDERRGDGADDHGQSLKANGPGLAKAQAYAE